MFDWFESFECFQFVQIFVFKFTVFLLTVPYCFAFFFLYIMACSYNTDYPDPCICRNNAFDPMDMNLWQKNSYNQFVDEHVQCFGINQLNHYVLACRFFSLEQLNRHNPYKLAVELKYIYSRKDDINYLMVSAEEEFEEYVDCMEQQIKWDKQKRNRKRRRTGLRPNWMNILDGYTMKRIRYAPNDKENHRKK